MLIVLSSRKSSFNAWLPFSTVAVVATLVPHGTLGGLQATTSHLFAASDLSQITSFMASLDDTDLARISSSAAEHFVDAYYNALNGSRPQIASFYVPATTISPGRGLPHISYNGEVLNDAAVLQSTFVDQMPFTHFDVQSFDVHVMNSSMNAIQAKSKKEHERNMSLVVSVSGYVRLQERKEGPIRGFSDSFVLVPNKLEAGGSQTGKLDHGRQWLIQTQNFRFVV